MGNLHQCITSFETENNSIKERLEKLEAFVTNTNTQTSAFAYQGQNSPKPVAGTTFIKYYIPQTATAATLNLTDSNLRIQSLLQLL